MKIKYFAWSAGIAAVLGIATVAGFYQYGRGLWVPAYYDYAGRRTVADVLAAYGPDAKSRLEPHFKRAGIAYPPAGIALLAMKEERRLELWAGGGAADGPEDRRRYRFVRAYDIKAASGGPGPKLREGDLQVPEGVYRITALHPNSAYHLSMKLNYPNAFDRRHARREGRGQPGSNIFIHGKALSVGCIAVGDRAVEELFTLVARIGAANVKVVIAPRDLRRKPRRKPRRDPLNGKAGNLPRWTGSLYSTIRSEFGKFRRAGDE